MIRYNVYVYGSIYLGHDVIAMLFSLFQRELKKPMVIPQNTYTICAMFPGKWNWQRLEAIFSFENLVFALRLPFLVPSSTPKKEIKST